ncbi:MAG TPA: RHS repeat-associated core domain-containing protein [Acidimicrobiales bacterium]|nr:RHS repeat-associated core domain-containing protein [Acidimicrobiales bacterium]
MTIPANGYAPDSDILLANDSVNGNWTYGYDDFNRLASASMTGQSYTYDYDRFGNRWHQNGPHSSSLSFSGNNNRMDTYSYDAAGNLLNDGTTAYTYDSESRIITATNSISGASSYLYDANGRRIRKTTAGVSVDFLYDLSGHEITQLSSTGTWNRGEIYAGGRHLGTYDGGTGGTTYFTFADWLGTERARSTSTGGPYETCTSLPFGDWLTCTGSTDPSPMHFTGKERDSESGLDNFGARYDSSQYGRFMSPDPTGGHLFDPQTLNKYAYVRNNPINFTDPTGLDLKEQCSEESDTCHKEHWYSRQRYVGTYDQNHHFQTTHFQTDQNGNLEGHQVNFDSSGVHIDGNRAQFIAGTPATRVNGAAGSAFDGMHFVANSNCGGTCDAGGALFGTASQFQSLVRSGNLVGPNPGLDAIDPFHPNSVQYRGGNTDGPDAHLSYQNSEDPNQQDPFHIDSRYPYGSAGGFLEHTGGVIHTIWNSATGNQGPPLPQDIPSASVPH